MNEQQALPSGSPDSTGTYELTPGAFLRESREAAGLHLATLAASLKVSVRKLEALEHDQFDLLPDAVFTRALASSVCRMLKLDPVPVLERLPPISAPKFVSQDRGINEPFRPRNVGPAPSVWGQVSRPAVLAGLVLLLGALVLIFLPTIHKETTAERAEAAPPATDGQALQSSPTLLPRTGAAIGDLATSATASASSAERAVSGGSEGAGPLKAAATLIVTAPAANGVVPANASSLVTFRATGESWVKVTDAKGLVVLNRTLRAGEVVDVSGTLPLVAVVGRADATQVQVRGQAFDLSTVSKSNVARFEVK